MIDGLDAFMYHTSPRRREDTRKPVPNYDYDDACGIQDQPITNSFIRMMDEIWSVYYDQDPS